MTGPAFPAARLARRSVAWLWPVAGLAALIAAVASPGLRHLLAEALAHVRPLAVLAALPGQGAAVLLCGAALFVLRPGVSFRASVTARLLRDAGANLLVILPGLGEVIGARALVLAGGQARAAVTASALDNLAEALAQLPFALLAVAVLPRLLRWPIALSAAALAPWLFALAAIAALATWLVVRAARQGRGTFGRLAARVAGELALLRREAAGRRRAMPGAIVLHALAWAAGGVQVWMIAGALSLPLGLFGAVVIESMTYAARGIAFFLPAGLLVQEATLVLAGLAYGLSPIQSLTIALVLRLRDVIFGLPLLVWPWLEFRRRRTAADAGKSGVP